MAVAKKKTPSQGSAKARRSGSKTREGDRSSSAAPAAPKITKEEASKLAAKPLEPEKRESLPGFTVTIQGSLPGAFCSIALRKGPIRASSKDAAVAQFMGDLSTQFKKLDLLEVQDCSAEPSAAPIQPPIPFGKGEEKKNGEAVAKDAKPSTTTTPAPAAAGTGASARFSVGPAATK